MSEAHKEVIRILVEAVLNKGNLLVLDEVVHPNYVCHSPSEKLHSLKGFIISL